MNSIITVPEVKTSNWLECESSNVAIWMVHLCLRLHAVDSAKYSCGLAEEDPNHFF